MKYQHYVAFEKSSTGDNPEIEQINQKIKSNIDRWDKVTAEIYGKGDFAGKPSPTAGRHDELKNELDAIYSEKRDLETKKTAIERASKIGTTEPPKHIVKISPEYAKLMERRKVLHPGSRGSMKWYVNERGEVIYGDRPAGIMHLTDIEKLARPSFATLSKIEGLDKNIKEITTSLDESKQKTIEMFLDFYKQKGTLLTKQDYMRELREVIKKMGVDDIQYERLKLGSMTYEQIKQLRESLKTDLNGILNQNPELKKEILKKGMEFKAEAEKARQEKAAKESISSEEQAKQKEIENKKREAEELAAKIAAMTPEELAKYEETQKEGAVNTAIIQDVLNGNITDQNVIKGIAALKNAGVLRIMNRGINKGQLQIDPKILNDIKYRMDKDEVTAFPLFMATGIYDESHKEVANVGVEKEKYKNEDGTYSKYVVGNDRFYEQKLGTPDYKHGYTSYRWADDQAMHMNEFLEKICAEINSYNAGKSRRLDLIAGGGEPGETLEIGGEEKDISKIIADTEKDRQDMLAAQENSIYTLPENFNKSLMRSGDLDEYQKKGVNWILTAKRGVLAFDTGLGKTLTTIAAGAELLNRKEVPRVIIYAPVSLMYQWKEEIDKWTKGYKAAIIIGTPEERTKQLRKAEKDSQFIMVTYGNLINDKESKAMTKMDGAIFFDEGKVFGSPKTKSYKNAKEILKNKKYAINMTATPIPNWAEDLFHMVNLFRPNSIGTLSKFKADFELVKVDAKNNRQVIGQKNSENLRKLVKPFVFFKNKFDKDINIVMPEMQSIPKIFRMEEDHNEYYKAAQMETLKEFLDVKNPDHMMPQEIANILARISYLRRVAISPALVDPKYDGTAPKIDQAVEEVVTHTINNPGHPIVVTAEFKESFSLIKNRLMKEHGFKESEISELTGDTPAEEREAIKQKTNAGENKVLLLAMKAGGYGLNLQGAANKMIFIHDPWTPTTKEQTIARIYRPGQKNKVTIIHHNMKGTIDSYMADLLRKKKEASLAIEQGVEGIVQSKMSFDDMLGLIGISRTEYDEMKKGGIKL